MPTIDEALQHAWAVHQQGNVQGAESIYRQVLAQVPNHPVSWCFLGIALHDQRRYQEAETAYRRAIELQPDFPIALNNLGNTLRYLYRPDEADRCFLEAIRQKPDYVNAYKNRGTLHVWTGNLDTALRSYQQAMQLSPDDAELHRNLGVLYLLKGDFDKGWMEYRWRWRCAEAPKISYSQPRWSGQDIRGKTLLLYAEQGLGDTLQFVRYAAAVRSVGAHVIVHGPSALTPLLSQAGLCDQWIPQNLPIMRPFDYHCSLVDVADVMRTDLTNIPIQDAYVGPAQNLVNYWREYFQSLPTAKLRVGLVWQGNKDHQADQFRSFPLKVLEPLSSIEGIQLVALQHGYGREQIAQWGGASSLITLPDSVDAASGAFMDTAAILKQLDVLITTDTSMAHLGGCLGIPTWTMLSLVPDWRWLLDRDDSPWYPSMRLFRQKYQGDWSHPVQAICEALRNFSPLR